MPAAPRFHDHSLENELAAKLQSACTVVARHSSKVSVMGTCVNALELSVVEGIEGLESQFDSRPFVGCEWDGFEQR